MKKKSLLLVAVLLLSAGLTTSCGEEKVIFLNFKPEVADSYKGIAAAYKKDTGKTIEIQTAASGTYDTTLTSQMGGKNKPAIFQVNGPVGLNKWKDYMVDLSTSPLYTNLSDKSLALKDGDKIAAVPNTVEGYGIIYNDKLAKKYFALTDRANATITSMDQVKSFTQLKAVVEDMTAHKADIDSKLKGVFSATSMKTGEDWRWQTHLFSLSLTGEYGAITSVPTTLAWTYKNEFRQVFDLYLDNSTKELNALSAVDVAASMSEFALGSSMMVQNGNWGAGQILNTAGCVVDSADIKFLPIYSGINNDNISEATQGLNIGTENYLCINNKVSETVQKGASDFLEWLYTGNGKSYVAKSIDDGGLGFIPTFNGFTGDNLPSDPLAKAVMSWMSKDGVKSLPWTFNYIPSEAVKKTLGADLLAYINANQSDATFNTAVSDTIAKWASEASAAK